MSDTDINKDEQEYRENQKLIYDFHEILMKLFTKAAVTDDDIEFAKHLTTYFQQKLTTATELGLGRSMLPVASISVWCGMMGEEKKEFVYRLEAIGGEPYVKLNLQRVSELLENAVAQWADESWGGIIEARQNRPGWVVDHDDE